MTTPLSSMARSCALGFAMTLGAGAAAQDGSGPAVLDREAGPASGLTLAGPWRAGPSLHTPRAGLSAAILDGRIYAGGGAGVVSPRTDFEMYEASTGRWRALSPLPVGLERAAMTAADGSVWIAGGFSEDSGAEPITQMWRYSPETDAWEPAPPLPAPRSAFCLLSDETALYAVAGRQGPAGLFVFDLDAQSWTTRSAPPEVSRGGAACALLDGALYVMGGLLDGEATARVDVYDILQERWTQAQDLPAPRAGHAAVAIDGALHVFGGRDSTLSRTLRDQLVYVPQARAWREAEAMISARTEAGAVALDGQAWLIGGGSGAGVFAPFTALDSVAVYTPGP
ncbi:MAG: kelch repeat-containing protein [Pseudomonadota bacterium]